MEKVNAIRPPTSFSPMRDARQKNFNVRQSPANGSDLSLSDNQYFNVEDAMGEAEKEKPGKQACRALAG